MKETEIDIRIVNISEAEHACRLYRWELIKYASARTPVRVTLATKIDLIPEKNQIKACVTASYTTDRGMLRRPLLDCGVDAVFEVDEFALHFGDSFQDDSNLDIPPSVISMMLSVAIGALRGIISLRTRATPLEEHPLPLVNISSLVSRMIYGSKESDRTVPVTALIFN